jgi:hypothetical protein
VVRPEREPERRGGCREQRAADAQPREQAGPVAPAGFRGCNLGARGRLCAGWGSGLVRVGIEGRNEAVTASRQRLDVARRLGDIAERAAKLADRRVQAGVEVHHALRPEHADQMLAGYDVSGMTDQLLEYECGLLGQPGAGAGALQVAGFGVEHPPIESEFLVVHRRSAPDQN